MTSFGKFIKAQREQKGWSQTEFGALIKINTPLLSRIENDKKNLSLDKLPLLAKALEMEYDAIKELYFADKFAKEAFQHNCTLQVFAVAESEVNYLRQKNTAQSKLKF